MAGNRSYPQIDLDALERHWNSSDHYGFFESMYQCFPALIAELHASRKVVEAATGALKALDATTTRHLIPKVRNLRDALAELQGIRE